LGRPLGSKNKKTLKKENDAAFAAARGSVLAALQNLAVAMQNDSALDALTLEELEALSALGVSLQYEAKNEAAKRMAGLERLRALADAPVDGALKPPPINGAA